MFIEIETSLGAQRFIFKIDRQLKCFKVVVEGLNPLPVYHILREQFEKVVKETMKSLSFSCFLRIPMKNGDDLFVNVELRNTLKENKLTSISITLPGSANLVTVGEMKETFQYWLVDNMDLDWYDSFISYRWGGFDSSFTTELWISLVNNHSIGKAKRRIRLFLDNQSLAKGLDFQLKFATALVSSVLALPIVSYNSLLRMKDHKSTDVDNLLIEWIIIVWKTISSRIQFVFGGFIRS